MLKAIQMEIGRTSCTSQTTGLMSTPVGKEIEVSQTRTATAGTGK